jgi:DNA repair protein RecN (Recombination protein N)
MLQLLHINNIALIDSLRIDFDNGLNLLTGETGSGKSIIVDSLGVLIGGRFTSDLLKSGTERASIEGLFILSQNARLETILETAGIALPEPEKAGTRTHVVTSELIIRRELSSTGRNKIFINNQLATQSLLRELRPFLVDIHGQGDQQTLFDADTHLALLDDFADNENLRLQVAGAYEQWKSLKEELNTLVNDEAKRFQLVDTLNYQIQELERAQLILGEDEKLEAERRRLLNVEQLTSLSHSSYARIYEDDEAALARLRQTTTDIAELAEYDSTFRDYLEGLESARALLEDLAFSLRNFAEGLEFSPARLAEIEDRLAELSRLRRKYGGSITSALEHLAVSQDRLRRIEQSDERATELANEVCLSWSKYFERAKKLHQERVRAARKFERAVEIGIKDVAMENGRFEVRISAPLLNETDTSKSPSDEGIVQINASGLDRVEYYFSANVGEELKPLARVASGGEASRLMLVLKTVANASEFPRTIVFDEIDAGIGGRVSEAVGVKLKSLAVTNQVLCVTHQAQIARFADSHIVVEKEMLKSRTRVSVAKLDRAARVEEIARMLTGAEITESARRHARELLNF